MALRFSLSYFIYFFFFWIWPHGKNGCCQLHFGYNQDPAVPEEVSLNEDRHLYGQTVVLGFEPELVQTKLGKPSRTSRIAQQAKNLPVMQETQETWVQSLDL